MEPPNETRTCGLPSCPVTAGLSPCSGCGRVAYCSPQHEQAHAVHAQLCHQSQNLATSSTPSCTDRGVAESAADPSRAYAQSGEQNGTVRSGCHANQHACAEQHMGPLERSATAVPAPGAAASLPASMLQCIYTHLQPHGAAGSLTSRAWPPHMDLRQEQCDAAGSSNAWRSRSPLRSLCSSGPFIARQLGVHKSLLAHPVLTKFHAFKGGEGSRDVLNAAATCKAWRAAVAAWCCHLGYVGSSKERQELRDVVGTSWPPREISSPPPLPWAPETILLSGCYLDGHVLAGAGARSRACSSFAPVLRRAISWPERPPQQSARSPP